MPGRPGIERCDILNDILNSVLKLCARRRRILVVLAIAWQCQLFPAAGSQEPGTQNGSQSVSDAPGGAEPSSGQIVDELAAKWRAQPNEKISTAEFEVEYFRIQHGGARRLITQQRLREFLEQVKTVWMSSRNSADIRELSGSLISEAKEFPNSWVSGRIVQRGEEVRNAFTANLIPGAFPDSHDTSYAGGVDTFYVVESKQVSVFPVRSNWVRFGLPQLREPLPVGALKEMEVVRQDPDAIQLRMRDLNYEIDRLSGGINWLRQAAASTARERWQCGFSDFEAADGTTFTFPAISATIDYFDGYVTNCFLFIIKSVRLNHPLPEDAFHVPVPAGTTVAYFPGERQGNATGLTVTREPTTNIAAMVPEMQKRATASPVPGALPAAQGVSRWWIVVVNLIALLLLFLGVMVLRRRKSA